MTFFCSTFACNMTQKTSRIQWNPWIRNFWYLILALTLTQKIYFFVKFMWIFFVEVKVLQNLCTLRIFENCVGFIKFEYLEYQNSIKLFYYRYFIFFVKVDTSRGIAQLSTFEKNCTVPNSFLVDWGCLPTFENTKTKQIGGAIFEKSIFIDFW